jgi:hypothetical protein
MTDAFNPMSATSALATRRDAYERRLATVQAEAERLARLERAVAVLRLTTAATALAAGLAWSLGWQAGASRWVGGAAALAFAILVALHLRLSRRAAWARAVAAVCHRQLARLDRRWSDLPPPREPLGEPEAVAGLGVFGQASLERLLDTTGTEIGWRTLVGWCLEPAAPEEVAARQAAVDELVGDADLRETLAANGALGRARAAGASARFLEWADAPLRLSARPWALWLARGLTAFIVTVLAVPALRARPSALAGAIAAGWLLTWTLRRRVDEAFDQASALADGLEAHARLLAEIERRRFAAPWLTARREGLGAPHGARRALAALSRLVELSELRHSAMPHAIVQSLTLWDLHVWGAVDAWRARHGRAVREWFRQIGEVDALAAVATLAADHPHWCRPELAVDAPGFTARQLAHPLLPPAGVVANDVEIGPPGSVLVVTGSNMSGKSTLLRAVGLGTILASMGAPVPAAAARLGALRVEASLQVADSLEEGVSYFLAALRRLQSLVAAARVSASGRRVLYLIDEILQGTNSRERHLAVRHILRHLVVTPAVGVLTTHDLDLTTTPKCRRAGVLVHFSDTIVERDGVRTMVFDYRLQPGPATSTNALLLVDQTGLSWPPGLEAPVDVYAPVPSRSRS